MNQFFIENTKKKKKRDREREKKKKRGSKVSLVNFLVI